MAAGTTVIASDAPGLRSLITDGETGRLFPAGDATALSQHIIALIGDEETRRILEKGASSYAESTFAEDSARTALQDSVCVSTV